MKWYKLDVADFLTSERQIKAYLAEFSPEKEPELYASALEDVRRARERYHLVEKPSWRERLASWLSTLRPQAFRPAA